MCGCVRTALFGPKVKAIDKVVHEFVTQVDQCLQRFFSTRVIHVRHCQRRVKTESDAVAFLEPIICFALGIRLDEE